MANNVEQNLPEPSITPNKDFDGQRHDVRILHLRGRPIFDWDVLHGNEILREQIGGLVDKLLTDGAFGDGWKATIKDGINIVINHGKIKVGNFIIELFEEENRIISMIPTVSLENIVDPEGINADRRTGNNVTFQLNNKNLRSVNGAVATPPNGSLEEFSSGLVDFYVQGTSFDIVQIDTINGFITFNSPPTLAEINEGIFLSYHYGRTGTRETPAILYAEIEMVRITGEEDEFLRDDILGIVGAWRDQFKIRFILDTESGAWEQILINALSHEGYGETYFVIPICTIIDGIIVSDDRPNALLRTEVAPFGDHGNTTGLFDDDHPQYLTKERHAGLDHSAFFAGLSKLTGITVFGTSGYSDRTVNIDTIKPFLVSVQAVDNTHIDVIFSEQIDLSTASNPANYILLDTATQVVDLTVFASTPLSSRSGVRLTTGNQANKQYTLEVSGVKDNFGNPIDSAQDTKDFAGKV